MKMIQAALLIMTAFLFSTNTFACGSDAECANDQICNDSGKCVADGRDWKALKTDLLISESIQKAKETGACYISAGSSKSCHDGLTFASCAKVASGVSGVLLGKRVKAASNIKKAKVANAAHCYPTSVRFRPNLICCE